MARILIGRLLAALTAVFGASVVAFVLLRALPSDPARLIVGPLASEEALQAQIRRMGLDRPLVEQYWIYATDFVRGDWGFSYVAGVPVRQLMAQRLPASIELGIAAFFIATLLAVSLAVFATYVRRGVDLPVRVSSFLALGIPPFWFGLISLMVFFEWLGIAPGPVGRLAFAERPPTITGLFVFDAIITGRWATAWEAVAHLVLPAVALALAPYGYVVRLLRANVLDSARAPHVRVALSKGISRWRAHRKHVVPNAILPTLTASGLLLAQLLGGSVLVEKVFNWPGVGTLVVDAILRQDFAVVQAFILLSALIYVFVNFIVDVLYGVIDPRLRRT